MTRLTLVGLLALLEGAAAAVPALATKPCVNRDSALWRRVRDPILDARTLQYCTGDDCWSLDLAASAITLVATRAPATAPPPDPHLDADEKSVRFCEIARGKACKSFRLGLGAGKVVARINEARTLGAVVFVPDGAEAPNGPSPQVIAFDLARGKQLGAHDGESIDVLAHGFVVDHARLFDAGFKPLGALAVPDRAYLAVGGALLLRDGEHGELVVQDATTAKVRARISTGLADHAAFFDLVPSANGKTVYAIGWGSDEGEVLAVDLAAAKVVARVTPPVCASGTHRAK